MINMPILYFGPKTVALLFSEFETDHVFLYQRQTKAAKKSAKIQIFRTKKKSPHLFFCCVDKSTKPTKSPTKSRTTVNEISHPSAPSKRHPWVTLRSRAAVGGGQADRPKRNIPRCAPGGGGGWHAWRWVGGMGGGSARATGGVRWVGGMSGGGCAGDRRQYGGWTPPAHSCLGSGGLPMEAGESGRGRGERHTRARACARRHAVVAHALAQAGTRSDPPD